MSFHPTKKTVLITAILLGILFITACAKKAPLTPKRPRPTPKRAQPQPQPAEKPAAQPAQAEQPQPQAEPAPEVAQEPAAPQERPFLLVKASDYPELRTRAERPPWSQMKVQAIEEATTLQLLPVADEDYKEKALRIRDIVSASALAYILDPANSKVYAAKVRDAAKEGFADLIYSRFDAKNKWTANVPVGCALFNTIIALDIVYDDLTAADHEAINPQIEELVGRLEGWKPAPQAVKGVWTLYQGKSQAFETNRNSYNKELFKYFTRDGVFRDGNGYANARFGLGDREQKAVFMDVLESQGFNEYYSNSKIRHFMEYLYGYAATPFGKVIPFGDSSPTSSIYSASNTQIFRAYQFSKKAAQYAAWHIGEAKPPARLLPYVLLTQEMGPPILAPSRIFKDGGAFFIDRVQSKESPASALWNPKYSRWHSHKEINALAMSAYGEHVLINAGYQGARNASHGFTWDYINHLAESGNTVTINGKDHADKKGAGIIEGFTGLGLDYATGKSGKAIDNGTHLRSLLFVQSDEGLVGYSVVVDKVQTDSRDSKANVNLHPCADDVTEVLEMEEYLFAVGPHKFSSNDVKLSIFLATPPESVEVKDGLLSRWGEKSFVGKYLRSNYPVEAERSIVTVLVPHDGKHAKPGLSRISALNYTGAIVGHSESVKDTVIESTGIETVSREGLSVKGAAAWWRVKDGALSAYFVRKGSLFNDAAAGIGFESEGDVSIYLEGTTGRIVSDGAAVKFYYPAVKKFLLDGEKIVLVNSGAGWVKIDVPAGVYKIAFAF